MPADSVAITFPDQLATALAEDGVRAADITHASADAQDMGAVVVVPAGAYLDELAREFGKGIAKRLLLPDRGVLLHERIHQNLAIAPWLRSLNHPVVRCKVMFAADVGHEAGFDAIEATCSQRRGTDVICN